jgi:DNA-binding GntR family transcriptional regulator
MAKNNNLLLLPTREEKLYLQERNLMPDRITQLLWDSILEGRIRPGTRLVERQLAKQLGISRVPVREALIQLEQDGLIVSRSDGRYVIELSEQDIGKLYQVRRVLEGLAVELAAQNTSPERAGALLNKLQGMREAVVREDRSAYVSNDIVLHRLIWGQANNPYLLELLRTLTGPIFMFVADNANIIAWEEAFELHENLISSINAGAVDLARENMEHHMDEGLYRAYEVFQIRKRL